MAAPIILASQQARAQRNANVTLQPEYVTAHPPTSAEFFHNLFGNELDSLVSGGIHPESVGSMLPLQSKALAVVQRPLIETGPAAQAVAARGRSVLARLGFRAQ